jgi:hypothetical protein
MKIFTFIVILAVLVTACGGETSGGTGAQTTPACDARDPLQQVILRFHREGIDLAWSSTYRIGGKVVRSLSSSKSERETGDHGYTIVYIPPDVPGAWAVMGRVLRYQDRARAIPPLPLGPIYTVQVGRLVAFYSAEASWVDPLNSGAVKYTTASDNYWVDRYARAVKSVGEFTQACRVLQ